MPRWGQPLGIPARSADSILIIEPTAGLDAAQPSMDAPLGSTPGSDNFIFRDGYMEPRPMLTLRNTTPQPFGNDPITGCWELQSVSALRYPIVSGTTQWAVYGQSSTPNGWSVLSYVSAGGLNDPPALAATDYVDFVQNYWPSLDENLAIGAASSYQSLYCTASNTTVFSTLTQAPRARYVTTFDNFVLAANIKTASVDAVQRVQWSDRGDPTSWTPTDSSLAGQEDLMALQGQITRIVGQESRVLIFSEREVWQGTRGDGVFVWNFAPLDRTVGAPYSWTVAQTPEGLIWLGKDYEVYTLPKWSWSGSAQVIGQKLHRNIRETIDHPERAFGVYDGTLGQYCLYYAIKGGSGYPQRAVYFDVNVGNWAQQSFDLAGGQLSLRRGTEIYVTSSATTWGGLTAANQAWSQVGLSWADLTGTSEQKSILVGSSNGTLYVFDSNATSDNGTAVNAFWQSTAFGGTDPSHQKTVTEFRVDYQSASASSLSMQYSTNGGATFGNQTTLNLPAVSSTSQAIDYPYFGARFPLFKVSMEGYRSKLYRFWVKLRPGGR